MLKFFGHELASDSVGPSEEKIAAIRDEDLRKTRANFDDLWGWFSTLQSSCPTWHP